MLFFWSPPPYAAAAGRQTAAKMRSAETGQEIGNWMERLVSVITCYMQNPTTKLCIDSEADRRPLSIVLKRRLYQLMTASHRADVNLQSDLI